MFIALIGYRGSGKTNVAPLLAKGLGWDWIDADDMIESNAGRSIAAIFADEGEPAFRDWESKVLSELVNRDKIVLALGGGVVLRPENREKLCDGRGATVWLRAPATTLFNRISADISTEARRPKLTAAGGLAEIQLLLEQREPFYQQCADFVVDTETKTPEDVAKEIWQWWRNREMKE